MTPSPLLYHLLRRPVLRPRLSPLRVIPPIHITPRLRRAIPQKFEHNVGYSNAFSKSHPHPPKHLTHTIFLHLPVAALAHSITLVPDPGRAQMWHDLASTTAKPSPSLDPDGLARDAAYGARFEPGFSARTRARPPAAALEMARGMGGDSSGAGGLGKGLEGSATALEVRGAGMVGVALSTLCGAAGSAARGRVGWGVVRGVGDVLGGAWSRSRADEGVG
eukprot:CAMPEP_0174896084 /NCGR_PEP_ID=MMETSP0167-20121228/10334_1 /TAXON_ID=38298 /ORGANISM="Rhodella maculata, Strain CCMP736" /LENGTH=219 /DNA_ID=CAMNT_0016135553 /DNA_START=461 /DNA_END=1117 /DNA_ORIENTATION=+